MIETSPQEKTKGSCTRVTRRLDGYPASPLPSTEEICHHRCVRARGAPAWLAAQRLRCRRLA
eukprot:3097589-Pleurochrysis_carterae.AAC.1